MNPSRQASATILPWAFRFWATHGIIITAIMLLSSLGRAIQMGVAGPVPSVVSWSLEVVVEVARVMALLAIVGHGNIRQGARNIGSVFRLKGQEWATIGRTARTTVQTQWPTLLIDLLLFSLVAWAMNALIYKVLAGPSVVQFLKDSGLLHAEASQRPVVFFLKNITVIPFTLIFEYGLIRWLTGGLPVIDFRNRPVAA